MLLALVLALLLRADAAAWKGNNGYLMPASASEQNLIT